MRVALLVLSALSVFAAQSTSVAGVLDDPPTTTTEPSVDPTSTTTTEPAVDPASTTTTEPAVDPTSTTTEPTTTEPTTTEPTTTEPTTTEPTTTEPTTTETVSYVVRFAPGSSTADQADAVAAADGSEDGSVDALNIEFVELPADAHEQNAAALESDPNVLSVELDQTRAIAGASNDADYAQQWALPQIGWDQAYGTITPSGTATIAVLDTGIDGGHPDLNGNLVAGTSILDGTNGLSDPNGHGTNLAGIAAAETGNGVGIAGVGYAGVNLMPVTVIAADGTGTDSDIIEGVVYAADNGADVILMGFSNPGYSEALQVAIDYAWNAGAVVVAATGNDGSSSPTYPAGMAGVMGVSSTTSTDTLASGSNSGDAVFLGAPGESIRATAAGGGYSNVSGTSASAAVVAGAAALLAADGASNGVVVNRLAANADPAGTAAETGNGRVNLHRALTDTSTDSIKPAAAPGGGPLVGPYVVAAPSDINTATHQGQQKVAGVTTTYTAGNVTEYFEGDSINFRFNLDSTATSPKAGVLEVRYSIEDATCRFFDGSFGFGTWDSSVVPIELISGSAVWTLSLDGSAVPVGAPNKEWVQRLNIDKSEFVVVGGSLDINRDGVIDGSDDGVVVDPGGSYFVIDGAIDMNSDGVIDGSDNGTFGGVPVIAGGFDTDNSGGVDGSDNATVTDSSAGEIRVNYSLTIEDDIGTCSGSSQHSRLNAPADGGDVVSAGAKNVPVPGGQILKFPDIVVTKYVDRNADGDYADPGELASAGEYEFTLDGATTLQTDANGQVVFESVTPDGDHTVTEKQIDFSQGIYEFVEGSGTFCTFAGSTATANVAAGTSSTVQDASCDFFNALSVFPPNIVNSVIKSNDADGDGNFSGEDQTDADRGAPGAPIVDSETVPVTATYPYTVPYQFTVQNVSATAAEIVSIGDDEHQAELEATLSCAGDGANTGPFTYTDVPFPIGAQESMTCTFDVDFDNADAGSVTNTLSVTAENEVGQQSTGTDASNVVLGQDPAIDIIKTGVFNDENGDGFGNAGETVTYTYDVENIGNVTLTSLAVADEFEVGSNANLSAITCLLIAQGGTLAPAATTECTATYTLTQADVDNGELINTATATGTDPDGVDTTDTDGETVDLPQNPAHTLTKTFIPDTVGVEEMGTFELVYTNTGNVTLTDVLITDTVDPRLVVGTVTHPAGSCPDPDDDAQTITCTVDSPLAPGDSVTITVEFEALGEDLVVTTGPTSGANYVFHFFNGYVLYGSTEAGTATLLDEERNEVPVADWDVAGANQDIYFTLPNPEQYPGDTGDGFFLHLSCSEAFIDGWGATGPIEGEDDADWNVVAYEVYRFNSQGFLKDCAQTFPFEVPNTAKATANYPPGDLPLEEVISDEVTLTVVNIAPIEVTRQRVRRQAVEIQYFNTSYEAIDLDIIQVRWDEPGVELVSASYQDGVDLGIGRVAGSGCGDGPGTECLEEASIATVLEARSRDWLKLVFSNGKAPAGLTVTIVTDTAATFTYVYPG